MIIRTFQQIWNLSAKRQGHHAGTYTLPLRNLLLKPVPLTTEILRGPLTRAPPSPSIIDAIIGHALDLETRERWSICV